MTEIVPKQSSPDKDRITYSPPEELTFQVVEASALQVQAQSTERLNRLIATIKNVAQSFELAEILPEIIKDASQLLNAESGDILLWDWERKVLKVAAVYNFSPAMLAVEIPLGEGLTSQAMASRCPVMVPDYLAYPGRVRSLDQYRFKAVLSVPLISRGQALGAINIHAWHVGYRYSEDDITLLAAFADHAAVAIDNAQRYENEKKLVNSLRQSNEKLTQSLAIQSQFTQQALHGHGLSGLAQRLAALIHRSVVIEDPFFNLLASSKADGNVAINCATPVKFQHQPDFRAALAALVETRQPTVLKEYDNRLITLVMAADDVLGYLTVLPGNKPLGDLNQVALDLAATNCALELVKLRAAFEAEARLRGDFVLDLVAGSFHDNASVIARATFLGYNLNHPYEVMVCDLQNNLHERDANKLKQKVFHTAHRLIINSSPQSLIALQGRSSLIFLISGAPKNEGGISEGFLDFARYLKRELALSFPQLQLSLALGGTGHLPADFKTAYESARAALDLMKTLGRSDQIIDTGQIGFYGLLLQSNSPEKLAAYARATFQSVHDHDITHHTELLGTLKLYFEHGGNKQNAARAAFLHINTLTYRLRKVQELLQVDLRNPDDLLKLQFAFKILEVMQVW